MSKIFELFGYRLDNWHEEAQANCARAWCPLWMQNYGVGIVNSMVDLKQYPQLANKFPNKNHVQAGVCSLQIKVNESPWIVCPRRLLALRNSLTKTDYQRDVKSYLAHCADLPLNKTYNVWSEVKMKVGTTTADEQAKSFDYSFDYVIAGSQRVSLSEATKLIGRSICYASSCRENGYLITPQEIIGQHIFPVTPWLNRTNQALLG